MEARKINWSKEHKEFRKGYVQGSKDKEKELIEYCFKDIKTPVIISKEQFDKLVDIEEFEKMIDKHFFLGERNFTMNRDEWETIKLKLKKINNER